YRINENFSQVFSDLFGGGTAEVNLEDEQDVLSCGIEIKAQPPGKKLQNLLLLSGGERCLTAIALLFAILKLRPTPFCVLDEVEAALDDANVMRFTTYIRRYAQASQFILVTHRKGTMEAADRLYGVTMQERGISRILSMQLTD
ncbi:MAG: chromosome segregation protein SMC, partial [Eubacteriales bacterium]|nr:chromosome segregation protein SMC [Eubacteriales bacterium]